MTSDPTFQLEAILNEADALIRKRLTETGLALPYAMIGVTLEGAAVLRSNAGPGTLEDIGRGILKLAKKAKAQGPTVRH